MSEMEFTAKDIMKKSFLSLSKDENISDAVNKLLTQNTTGAPVINEHSKVLGFLSEQDCIKQMLNSAFYCDLTATVEDIMVKGVITVSPNCTLSALAELFINHKPKIYPVVEEEKIVGVVGREDVLAVLQDEMTRCRKQSN